MATCVREVREQRGMTQAALAAKAGISREYLNQDRERPIRPEVSVVVKIAEALRVRVDDLVGGSGKLLRH
jgi:transcriptional regulator with XRE-family HTH domain